MMNMTFSNETSTEDSEETVETYTSESTLGPKD
jgi:hypothetical protein